MPKRRTGSVTVYHGKRGKAFGIRYRDADGRRVSETLGSQRDGWTTALMAKAGHSDFKTTQGYIDLGGETFRGEEELLDARLFGQKSGQK